MAEQSRVTLKTYFETGDKPTEAEFIDLIDSLININDDDSDVLTEGATNLFLTAAERVILGNTSNTNTGDQTSSDFTHNNLTGVNLAASGEGFGHIDDQAQTIVGEKGFAGGVIIDPLDTFSFSNGLRFGSGYTGFLLAGANDLRVNINNVGYWKFLESKFMATNGNAQIVNSVATATTAVFRIRQNEDTGIGGLSNQYASLIAKGVEGIRVTNTDVQFPLGLTVDPNQTFLAANGLKFGGNGTAIVESGSGILDFYINGTFQHRMQETVFKGASNQSYRFRNITPSNTFPNICPHNGNSTTGIGWAGTNQLSLIAGSVEGIRVTNTDVQFPLGLTVDPNATYTASNGIGFGDGDTILYESADDNLVVQIAAIDKFVFKSNSFESVTEFSARIQKSVGSATDPIYNFVNDEDTGVGRAGANQLSLISGGTEMFRIDMADTSGDGGTGTLRLGEILFSWATNRVYFEHLTSGNKASLALS